MVFLTINIKLGQCMMFLKNANVLGEMLPNTISKRSTNWHLKRLLEKVKETKILPLELGELFKFNQWN